MLTFLESHSYYEVVEESRVRLKSPNYYEVKDIQHGNEQVEYVNVYPQYESDGGASINDDGDDLEQDDERHHKILGDIEAQVKHKDMDPNIDEDGCTEKEAEWYTKISGRDHKVPSVEEKR